jgi:hypothetical protein
MLSVRKRMEIKQLLYWYTPTAVARLASVSVTSVKRIAMEEDVCHLDDASERRRRKIGRPSKVRGYEAQIVEMLRKDPRIKTVKVLRRLELKGYSGGKTAVYTLVASLRRELAGHTEARTTGDSDQAGTSAPRDREADADRVAGAAR